MVLGHNPPLDMYPLDTYPKDIYPLDRYPKDIRLAHTSETERKNCYSNVVIDIFQITSIPLFLL